MAVHLLQCGSLLILQVRDPKVLESGVLGQGGLRGVPGRGSGVGAGVVGMGSGEGVGFFGQGGVGSATGEMRVVGPTGRDQTYTPQGEPTFRKGDGAKGKEKCLVFLGLELAGFGLRTVPWRGVERMWLGREDPLPPGPVLAQRDQTLGALKALVEDLGPVVGPQVMGLVEGCCPRNQPLLSLPPSTDAEMVARFHELYAEVDQEGGGGEGTVGEG